MREVLTPSHVLEEYDVVGRKVPHQIIAHVRTKFASLERDGISSWTILRDEVRSMNLKKRIDQDRLWIVQMCAEVLLEKKYHNKSVDGFSWNKRIGELSERDDYLHFFALLNLTQEQWSSATWLVGNGYQGIWKAITQVFSKWEKFLHFMGLENQSLQARIARCTSPKEYIAVIRTEGITGDEWHSSSWLQKNGYSSLYNCIAGRTSSAQFANWKDFLIFMGIFSTPEKVKACKSPQDYQTLFNNEGIKGTRWRTAIWLQKNNHTSLYFAIKEKFGTWHKFIQFMGVNDQSIVARVKRCSSYRDYLSLIREAGIPGNEWQNSNWLCKNGHKQLYRAISSQFSSWLEFLKFMRIDIESLVVKLGKCKTKFDVQNLLTNEGIPTQKWVRTTWLQNNGFGHIYDAIRKRFGPWKNFLNFMGVKDKSASEKVAMCHAPEDFHQLFRNEGIVADKWQISSWLQENGYGSLCRAILKKFGNWTKFIDFMGIVKIPWKEKVSKCGFPEDFIELFKAEGITGSEWENSKWLCKQGLNELYRQILKRFNSWQSFLDFMGVKDSSIPGKISRCNSRDDYLAVFSNEGIIGDQWKGARWLQENGFKSIYRALYKKFGSWMVFLCHMDGHLPFEGIKNENEAKRLLNKEILRLRETGNWIVNVSTNIRITKEEYEEISKPQHYHTNPVVRAVADYINSKTK